MMNDFKFLKVLAGYCIDYYLENLIEDCEIPKIVKLLDNDIDEAIRFIALELSKIEKLTDKIKKIDKHYTSDYIIFYLTLQNEYPEQYEIIKGIITELLSLIDYDIKLIMREYLCNMSNGLY